MFCSNCGKQLDEQAKFCSRCGSPVSGRPVSQVLPNTPNTMSIDLLRPKKDTLQTVDSENGKRSEVYLSCKVPPIQAAQIAEQILINNGFKPKDYKGESVWKKGTGMATSMQFVKVAPFDDALGIQAWVQSGIGDVGLREQCLDGFGGALPKKMLLKVVEQIQGAI